MSNLPNFTKATKPQLRKALTEAWLALSAIGKPEPLSPPDGQVAGHIARSGLIRIEVATETQSEQG